MKHGQIVRAFAQSMRSRHSASVPWILWHSFASRHAAAVITGRRQDKGCDAQIISAMSVAGRMVVVVDLASSLDRLSALLVPGASPCPV